jgi:hypothetical protein
LSLSPRMAEILAELALSLRAPVGRLPPPAQCVGSLVLPGILGIL